MPDDKKVTPGVSDRPGEAEGAPNQPRGDSQGEDESKAWAQAAEGWTIGLMFPLSIAAGYLVGLGADKLFHSSPWGQIIGTALGIVAGFVNLFRIGMRDGGDAGKPPAGGR